MRRHLLVLLLFAVATAAMTWPLITQMTTHLPYRHENYDMLLNTWILGWGARALLTGDLANFLHGNADHPLPYGMTYSDHLLGWQPVVLPVYALSGSIILAHNVATLLTFVLVGYFMYLLVRHLSASDGGAIVAGLAFAFVPWRFAQWHHVQLLGFQWMPLALLCLHRLVDRPHVGWGVAAGAALAMQALTGMYQGVYLALAAVLFVAYFGLVSGAVRRRGFWLGLAALAAVVLVTNGPFLVTYSRVHRAYALVRDVAGMERGSLPISRYLYAHPTNRLLQALGVPVPEERQQFQAWLGATVVLAALIGLGASVVRWRRLKTAVFYLLMAALFWVLSLGPTIQTTFEKGVGVGPYRWLADYVPGFKGMRYPARMSMMVSLGLTVLAGLGVAAIARRPTGRTGWRGRTVAVAVIAGLLVCVEFWSAPLPTKAVPFDDDTRALVQYLAARDDRPVIAHFPASGVPGFMEAQRQYHMYLSTFHWQRIIKAGPGDWPAFYLFVRHRLAEFPDPRTIDVIQALGVTDAVVLAGPAPDWPFDAARLSDPRLTPVERFGRHTVYRVAPAGRDWRAALGRPGTLLVPAVAPAGGTIRAALDLSDTPALAILGAPLRQAQIVWAGPERAVPATRLSRLGFDRLAFQSGDFLPLEVPVPDAPGDWELRVVDETGVLAARPVRVVLPGECWTGPDDAAPRAEIILTAPLPARVPPGAEFPLAVEVSNAGVRTWGCRTGDEPGRPDHAVRVAWYLKDAAGEVVDTGRGFLPADLAPGQSVRLRTVVPAPQQVGEYELFMDAVMKHEARPAIWFGARGSTPLRRHFTVAPDEG